MMKISYFKDQPSITMNIDKYLEFQNPLILPIGSSSASLLTSTSTSITTKYSSKVNLNSDNTQTTVFNFDKNFVYPKKLQNPILTGGIFVESSSVSGSNTIYPFYILSNTKIPSSSIFLPTLTY